MWNRVDMRWSWESQPPLHKVKKAIFIGQVMNVVSAEVHRPFGALILTLIHSPLVFSVTLFLFSFIFVPHSLVPPLAVTLYLSFSPICSLCLSHGIYCNWLYLFFCSPLPHFLPLCLPVFLFTVDQLLLAWGEGDLLAGPRAATQDMGPASPPRSCLVLQPVELPV